MQLLTAHEAGEIAWLWNDHWKEALCQWICSRSVSKFHLHCSRCLIDKEQSETQLPPSSKLRVQNVIRWFQIIAHLWAHAFQRSCAHLDFLISYTGGANRYLNFISYTTNLAVLWFFTSPFPTENILQNWKLFSVPEIHNHLIHSSKEGWQTLYRTAERSCMQIKQSLLKPLTKGNSVAITELKRAWEMKTANIASYLL